jgi:hypothetical protein
MIPSWFAALAHCLFCLSHMGGTQRNKVGWLLKQSDYLKQWRRRWFVLRNGVLSYFRNPSVRLVPRRVYQVVADNVCMPLQRTTRLYTMQRCGLLTEAVAEELHAEARHLHWLHSLLTSAVRTG